MQIQRIINSLKSLCLLGVLLFVLNASNTYADFYVVAGSRGVGTKINALPYTIASSGFYFIAKDLSCVTGSHGITITADNVTLDLMGFSLIGPGGSSEYNGIHIDGKSNAEIRNGTVRYFANYGVYDINTTGTGHRIINIRLRNNGGGIKLSGSGNLVQKCTAVSNGFGIYVGSASTVTGNTCYNNTVGSGIDTGTGTTVTNNTCYGNSGNGIATDYGATVNSNTCYYNNSNGIYVLHGSTVTNNTCYNNHGSGIYGTSQITVAGNTCSSNDSNGIYVGNYSTVISNTCTYNSNDGLYLYGNSFVDQNTTVSNGRNNMFSCPTCTFGTNHAP